jgi:uncharacterized protein (DUF1684 family)
MRVVICGFLFSIALLAKAQENSYTAEVKQYRAALNREFANPEESPLTKEGLAVFDSLHFFPIDSNYRVLAYLERTPEMKSFEMLTTTSRKAVYRQYGILHFTLKDTVCSMPIYQNLRLLKMEGYADYLFLPFTDYTNGLDSYGGGRFLDARIPENDTLLVDFNKAYNPYCAYNSKYSCPIPPKENKLPLHIPAGVKNYHGTH